MLIKLINKRQYTIYGRPYAEKRGEEVELGTLHEYSAYLAKETAKLTDMFNGYTITRVVRIKK